MKKFLLAFALCLVAMPSYSDLMRGVVVKLKMAEDIIVEGKTLQQYFDSKKEVAYFIKLCNVDKRSTACGTASLPDGSPANGIWFCTVDSEGRLSCKSDKHYFAPD